MGEFDVAGSFRARRGYWQPFVMARSASNEAAAREKVLSELGSCHGVKRALVRIETVTERPA
ncbi:MAG: 50S ribosomal protein L18a [Thermoplasmata archaeon]|nr:50S ribosomal protein L18a [Thermoplasmata archaeon]